MTSSSGSSGNRPTRRTPGQQPSADQRNWAVEPVHIDTGKRVVALIIDVAASYFVSIIVSFLPFIREFLPPSVVMVAYFLCRDFLFEGRGIGKNLMGLQVVDISTGEPASLMQSVMRSIVPLAPFVVLQVVTLVLRFVPLAWLSQMVMNLTYAAGMVYCLIVIPIEAYRVNSRPDGLRIGDEIAGTALIEAPMDFSHFLSR